MKNTIKSISYILLILVAFVSCEKDISVDMPKPEDKLVVEGIIELNDYSIVFLTKNAAYFDIVDTATVNNSIISGGQATVIVTDGSITDTLVPHVFPKWPYYGYYGTQIKGSIGNTYDLKILYDNNEYTATTFIPDTVGIDSVWFDKFEQTDSLGFLNFNFQDPYENGNYYSCLVRVHQTQPWFYRSYFGTHITDDKLGNNMKFSYSPISKGYERNSFFNNSSNNGDDPLGIFKEIGFSVGDTVSLKLSTMDQISYNIWGSWYSHQATSGNPFTNPATVLTNIDGAPAKGYWIGYGSDIKTVYITDTVNIEIID